MNSPGTKICVLVLHQWLKNCYSRTLHSKKKKKGRFSKQTALNPAKNSRRPWTVIQGPRIYWYVFSTGLGPSFKDWEGMLFLIWNLVQLHGRAKWRGGRRGKLGLCQTYLKSEKEGRWRGLTPSRLLCMPFRGIRGQIQSIQEAKNIRALINSCAAGADAIFKLCASNSQPVVVNTHALQQQAQRDIQKRDGLLGLRVVGQSVRGILISRFFLFVLHCINGGITFFWVVCLETQLCQSEEGNLSFSGKSNILAKLPVDDTMPVSDPGLPRLEYCPGITEQRRQVLLWCYRGKRS